MLELQFLDQLISFAQCESLRVGQSIQALLPLLGGELRQGSTGGAVHRKVLAVTIHQEKFGGAFGGALLTAAK